MKSEEQANKPRNKLVEPEMKSSEVLPQSTDHAPKCNFSLTDTNLLNQMSSVFHLTKRIVDAAMQNPPKDQHVIDQLVTMFRKVRASCDTFLDKYGPLSIVTDNSMPPVQERVILKPVIVDEANQVSSIVQSAQLIQGQENVASLPAKTALALDRELTAQEIDIIKEITYIGFSDTLARDAITEHPDSVEEAIEYCMDHPDSMWPYGEAFKPHFARIDAKYAQMRERRKKEAERPRPIISITFHVALANKNVHNIEMKRNRTIGELKTEIQRLEGNNKPLTLYFNKKLLQDDTTLDKNRISFRAFLTEEPID